MKACAYASDFWHKCLRDFVPFVQFKKREKHPWRSEILGKTPNRARDIKNFYSGLGRDKKRLNVLYFTNTNILIILPPTLNKASESKESK